MSVVDWFGNLIGCRPVLAERPDCHVHSTMKSTGEWKSERVLEALGNVDLGCDSLIPANSFLCTPKIGLSQTPPGHIAAFCIPHTLPNPIGVGMHYNTPGGHIL